MFTHKVLAFIIDEAQVGCALAWSLPDSLLYHRCAPFLPAPMTPVLPVGPERARAGHRRRRDPSPAARRACVPGHAGLAQHHPGEPGWEALGKLTAGVETACRGSFRMLFSLLNLSDQPALQQYVLEVHQCSARLSAGHTCRRRKPRLCHRHFRVDCSRLPSLRPGNAAIWCVADVV